MLFYHLVASDCGIQQMVSSAFAKPSMAQVVWKSQTVLKVCCMQARWDFCGELVSCGRSSGNNREDFRLVNYAAFTCLGFGGFFMMWKKICLESFLIPLSEAKSWESRGQKSRLVQIIQISLEMEGWAAPAPLRMPAAPEWDGEGEQRAGSGSADGGKRKLKQRKEGFYSLSFTGHFFFLISSSSASSSFSDVFGKIHKFLMFKEWIKSFWFSGRGRIFLSLKVCLWPGLSWPFRI